VLIQYYMNQNRYCDYLYYLQLNIPVVKSPPKVNVPAVNVYVPVAVNAYVLLNVTLPAVCVNVNMLLKTDVPY
jgi:hypothetical protein